MNNDVLLNSMIQQALKYNKGGDELRIKIKWGDLVAKIGYDADYPEIYIFLEMKDKVEFTLGVIGQDSNKLKVRTKEWIESEDLTQIFTYPDDEINQAWSEVVNG